MDKKKISEIENFSQVSSSIGVLGYDSNANKIGLVPFDKISGGAPVAGFKRKKADANTEGTPFGDMEFLANLPNLMKLGGYLVKNDHTRKKLSAKTHLEYENGVSCVLDGTAGHYQWGWNVPFYYSNWEDDTWLYEAMSFSPIKGHWNYYIPVGSRSAAGYCILDSGTGALKSVGTAVIPVVNKAIGTLQTAAHKNGDLWFANERVMQFITAFLKRLIFHNTNIQAARNATLTDDGLHQGGTGEGYSDSKPWENGYLPLNALVEDGDALEVGTFSGDTTINDGTAKTISVTGIPNFFGLKNDYKYLWEMSENELLQCNSDGSQTLYIDESVGKKLFDLSAVTNHVVHSKGPAASAAAWLYPKTYHMHNLAFWPDTVGGSTSTYYADGYYNPAATSGLRGVIFAGNAGNGGAAGSLYAYGSSGVGVYSVSWSAFLCEWAEAFDTVPVFYE